MIEELTTKEQVEQLVKEHLDCPCTCFPPMKDNAPILDVYYQVRERGKREGFTPLLIVLDPWGNPVNLFHCQKEFWQKAASEPVEDGRALLHRFEAELRKEWGEDLTSKELEERLCEVLGGDRSEGEEITGFLSLMDRRSGQTPFVVLAEIPVKHPWDIFAYLPFGGWNECPGMEEQRAAAKYWFEEYGAELAVMSADVLEYILPAPVPQDRAMEAALEQFFFCTDIVEQGVGTVGVLAGSLAQSKYWYFWWD